MASQTRPLLRNYTAKGLHSAEPWHHVGIYFNHTWRKPSPNCSCLHFCRGKNDVNKVGFIFPGRQQLPCVVHSFCGAGLAFNLFSSISVVDEDERNGLSGQRGVPDVKQTFCARGDRLKDVAGEPCSRGVNAGVTAPCEGSGHYSAPHRQREEKLN